MEQDYLTPLSKIEKGMRVRVRDFEDMATDYKRFASSTFLDEELRDRTNMVAFVEGMKKYCGTTFVVTKLCEYGARHDGWTFSPAMLTLAHPNTKGKGETMETNIKAGDRAVVMNTAHPSKLYNKGMIVTVKEVAKHPASGRLMASVVTEAGHMHPAWLDNLKPYDVEKEIIAQAGGASDKLLKVGDYASVLRTRHPGPGYKPGIIVKVKEINTTHTGKTVALVVTEDGVEHGANINNLTKVEFMDSPKQIDTLFLQATKIEPKTKRHYSTMQVVEAARLADKIKRELTRDGMFVAVSFCRTPNDGQRPSTEVMLLRSFITGDMYIKLEEGKAVLSDDDEWNDSIGEMVALCKATETEMPAWVHGK